MAMQHIDIQPCQQRPDIAVGSDVVPAEIAGHGDACQAEGEVGGELGQPLFGQAVVRVTIDDDADLMAARGLRDGEIADMPEQAANWSAEAMDDTQ
jgi:hypothetical protein